jgi:hypothetical protein
LGESFKVKDTNIVEINDNSWIKYLGEFNEGLKNGIGKEEHKNAYFVGRFKHGKINGIGSFHINKNQWIQGIWNDNVLQKEI